MLALFFKYSGIRGTFDVAMEEVAPGELRLADGRTLPFKYAMIVPPFLGADVVHASGLGNARGFIEVEDTYQPWIDPMASTVSSCAQMYACSWGRLSLHYGAM